VQVANDIFEVSTRFASPALITRISRDPLGRVDQRTIVPEIVHDESFSIRK
jgi:hypothetical protein